MPAYFGMQGFAALELCELLCTGRGLELLLPLINGHAVNVLLCLAVIHIHCLGFGRSQVPFCQAVTAESGQVHQVDILHIGPVLQVFDQSAKCRGFNFNLLLSGHDKLHNMIQQGSTIHSEESALSAGLNQWFVDLDELLSDSHQRSVVMIRGSRQWCLSVIDMVTHNRQSCDLSGMDDFRSAIAFSKAENLLGKESDIVVYDQFSGLNADVFCLAVGLVKAGGILLWVVPNSLPDPDDAYGCWQERQSSEPRFFNYLAERFSDSAAFYTLWEHRPLPALQSLPLSPLVDISLGLSDDQQELMQQMNSWLEQGEQPLFLLTADRGRGKSTCLGKFAQAQSGKIEVTITSASRQQAAVLLKQLDDNSSVCFMSPDEIIRQDKKHALLVVDEAAMMPASVLQRCIALSDKALIATTTGGYEGTGQGFLLKFKAELDQRLYCSGLLSSPIRWGQNDQVESLLSNTLLMSSSPLQHTEYRLSENGCRIEMLDKKQLSADLPVLLSAYCLLVSAHYRTRPSDLRQLMEDDNQLVLLAHDSGRVIGVLLLNREGGFDRHLSEQVFMGRRRPTGHLLSQMMTVQGGIKHFACYQGLRIQRIAVHEQYRRRGIGRRLVEQAMQYANQHELDYLGSSFALDRVNVAFWKACGFRLQHIASGKGKSSARQSLVVLLSSHKEVQKDMRFCRERIYRELPLWLQTYCRELYWRDVIVILELFACDHDQTDQETDEIRAFAEGHRGFDYSQPALQRLLVRQFQRVQEMDDKDQQLLVEKVLLNYSWSLVQQHYGLNGSKAVVRKLRQLVGIVGEQNKQCDR